MSYILDALKKSEQERKKGTVPGLGTVQDLPGGHLDPRRAYLPALLFLLAALAGLAWLFLREPSPPAPAVVEPATQAPAGTPAKTSSRPESPGARGVDTMVRKTRVTTPAEPTKKIVSQSPALAPTPGGSVVAPPAAPPATPAPAAAKPPGAIAAPPHVTPHAAPVAATASEDEDEMAEMDPAEEPPPATPDAHANSEDAPPVKPEDLPVVPLADLPAETRAEMPEIKIGIHFFSDDPGSRRAGINGRLLHEGQQVDKDLLLQEITREGVILSFKARKFSLAVFPR